MKKEEKSLFEKLYEASEEQASRFAKEVVSHPSFSSIMEKALLTRTLINCSAFSIFPQNPITVNYWQRWRLSKAAW
jgi:hypothetical protein